LNVIQIVKEICGFCKKQTELLNQGEDLKIIADGTWEFGNIPKQIIESGVGRGSIVTNYGVLFLWMFSSDMEKYTTWDLI